MIDKTVTSIDLPAEEGYEWREVGYLEYEKHWTKDGDEAIFEVRKWASLGCAESAKRYFIRVKTVPDWVSIPEGTLCEVSIKVKDGAQVLERMLWREGKSFTYQRGDGFYMPLDEILSARPLRVLGEDEVAVKRVKEPHTNWDVTAAVMGAKGYDEISKLCCAYFDALEREGKS